MSKYEKYISIIILLLVCSNVSASPYLASILGSAILELAIYLMFIFFFFQTLFLAFKKSIKNPIMALLFVLCRIGPWIMPFALPLLLKKYFGINSKEFAAAFLFGGFISYQLINLGEYLFKDEYL